MASSTFARCFADLFVAHYTSRFSPADFACTKKYEGWRSLRVNKTLIETLKSICDCVSPTAQLKISWALMMIQFAKSMEHLAHGDSAQLADGKFEREIRMAVTLSVRPSEYS